MARSRWLGCSERTVNLLQTCLLEIYSRSASLLCRNTMAAITSGFTCAHVGLKYGNRLTGNDFAWQSVDSCERSQHTNCWMFTNICCSAYEWIDQQHITGTQEVNIWICILHEVNFFALLPFVQKTYLNYIFQLLHFIFGSCFCSVFFFYATLLPFTNCPLCSPVLPFVLSYVSCCSSQLHYHCIFEWHNSTMKLKNILPHTILYVI